MTTVEPLNMKSWTPRYIIEELLTDMEDVTEIVIALRRKDGTLDTRASYMPVEFYALLQTTITLRLHEHLRLAYEELDY